MLAAPRVAAVQGFFQTSSKTDLFGSYAWCQATAAGLLPILGDFEIALRNALHKALSQHYGGQDSFNWMMTSPNPKVATNPNAAPLPAPHKMGKWMVGDIARMQDKLTTAKKRPPSPDDMVAALPFGFWEQLIKSLDHPSHKSPALQGTILAAVFPNAPDLATTPYVSQAFRDRVTRLLYQIRDVRNRIGHHDSVWSCPEFDEQGTTGFFPRRPRHTVKSMGMLADRITWFASWIDASITDHIHGSDHWASFQKLLSRKALAIYRINGGRAGTTEMLFALQQESNKKSGVRVDNSFPLLPHQINQYHF